MKKIIALFFIFFFSGIAYAQVTAGQILLGYLTTSGCPGGALVCWFPYTSSNPMPVSSN